MRRPLRAVGAVCAIALVIVVPACSGSAGRVQRAVATRAASPSGSVAAGPVPARMPATAVDPGRLPQTTQSPSTRSVHWQRAVAGFWRAVQTGDVAAALPAFFPLSAYVQVKPEPPAVANDDWHTRLIGHYEADLKALHAWLGPHAASARLLGVDVPDSTATWVRLGVEFNRLRYWRVYDTRVRVSADGRDRTFGIASMISWRGEWYIVHLGSITGPAGTVRNPQG